MKHDRQILMAGWDQEKIRRTSIEIVGAGALGSSLALTFARLGIGRIRVVDYDTLEEHNLENQCYDASDLGQPKVQALAERIARIDPSIRVEGFQGRVQDDASSFLADYVFGCIDNPGTRLFLSGRAWRNKVPLIDAGIEGFIGQVKTIIPGITPCHGCLPTMRQAKLNASCSSVPIPTTYVTASTLANFQVVQFLKLLRGEKPPATVQVDLWRPAIFAWDMVRNPDCQICGGMG